VHAGLDALLYFGGRETHTKRRTTSNELMQKPPLATDQLPASAAKALKNLGENLALVRQTRKESLRAWAARTALSMPTFLPWKRVGGTTSNLMVRSIALIKPPTPPQYHPPIWLGYPLTRSA
jgi:hypothetical protein